MANATITISLSVTDSTQAGANQRSRKTTEDAIKKNLGALNDNLFTLAPDPTKFVPLLPADIDAANGATLARYLTMIVRGFLAESARSWRTQVADMTLVQPVRQAPSDLDPVV